MVLKWLERGTEESTIPISFLSGYAYICVYTWVSVPVEARSLKSLVGSSGAVHLVCFETISL